MFTSTTGRIEGRRFTGLTAKNQRRVARAVRQARAAGTQSCRPIHTAGCPR